ncbi:MAG: GTP 3',8-cyclase MoaA [Flavobacteriaceae bacterium]
MQDAFDREINYVRIAVTDRCNLRCFYCMPAKGIPYEPKSHLLSYEEITRLLRVLGELGFKKVRFTGGEPFLRKDFMQLLETASKLPKFESVHITSNGTLLRPHLPMLKELGITKINLSLDSLDPKRFKQITRRDDFVEVMDTLYELINNGFSVKINAVVMQGINVEDIVPLAQLTKQHPIEVRFIEEMPFNGGYRTQADPYRAKDIFTTLKAQFHGLRPLEGKHGDTANVFQIPGHTGSIGIIAAFTRTFCNTCNRLRISPKGDIKTCLYDGGVFNIRDFMRNGATDKALLEKFRQLIRLKPKDGFAAETSGTTSKVRESMSEIGG